MTFSFLYQAFTDDKAQIIEDSVGNIISFSCSNIETLKRLSERSGVYTNPISGKTSPTISADSIARFESGQALVFSGPLVFTTQFAFDEEKSTDVPIIFPKIETFTIKKRTDVMKPIWVKKKAEVEKLISEKMSKELGQTTFKLKKKMYSREYSEEYLRRKNEYHLIRFLSSVCILQ